MPSATSVWRCLLTAGLFSLSETWRGPQAGEVSVGHGANDVVRGDSGCDAMSDLCDRPKQSSSTTWAVVNEVPRSQDRALARANFNRRLVVGSLAPAHVPLVWLRRDS